MLTLLVALAGCPATPADTVPLLPKALVWMSQDTAVVAKDSASGLEYELVNVGDSAVAIYRDCHYLGTVRNSIEDDAEYPGPSEPAIWHGGGLKVIFVGRRHPEELQKTVELVGIVRE